MKTIEKEIIIESSKKKKIKFKSIQIKSNIFLLHRRNNIGSIDRNRLIDYHLSNRVAVMTFLKFVTAFNHKTWNFHTDVLIQIVFF